MDLHRLVKQNWCILRALFNPSSTRVRHSTAQIAPGWGCSFARLALTSLPHTSDEICSPDAWEHQENLTPAWLREVRFNTSVCGFACWNRTFGVLLEGRSGSITEFMDDVIIWSAQNAPLSYLILPKLKIIMITHNSSEMFLKLW